MRRRTALTVLTLGAASWAGGLWPRARATAQQGPELRIVGRPRNGQARFRLINRSASALTYTTYDGGNVHNQLERQDRSGAWTDVSPGYCGLGQDGVVTVPPGGEQVVLAYVQGDAGTYRVRVGVEAGAAGRVEIVSPPFVLA